MQLGTLEQRIMKHLWAEYQDTAFTVRDIVGTLNTRGTHYAYNTILTVMTHLFEKGLLTRERQGKTCIYSVAVSENAFVGKASRDLFETMKKQYGTLAIAHFANLVDAVDPTTLRNAKKALESDTQKRV